MEGKKIRAIGTSLILCLAAMTISGCDLRIVRVQQMQ